MGDADPFHSASVIEVIEYPISHDGDIALFPHSPNIAGRIFKGDEFGVKLNENEVAFRKKIAKLKDFFGMGMESAVVSLELFSAVESPGGSIGSISVIKVLDGDIRSEVAGDLIIAFIIKMVDIFQVLLAIHGNTSLRQRFRGSLTD